MELWDCRHLLVFYDVVDSVIRSFYTDLSLLTLFPLIVVMKTMLLLWLAYVTRVKLSKLQKLIISSLWWNISCLHFIGVVYYPALIMIWCDMFTSILLLTGRASSILHGFCVACTISDVSLHITETTINIISIKYIPQYQRLLVTDFL